MLTSLRTLVSRLNNNATTAGGSATAAALLALQPHVPSAEDRAVFLRILGGSNEDCKLAAALFDVVRRQQAEHYARHPTTTDYLFGVKSVTSCGGAEGTTTAQKQFMVVLAGVTCWSDAELPALFATSDCVADVAWQLEQRRLTITCWSAQVPPSERKRVVFGGSVGSRKRARSVEFDWSASHIDDAADRDRIVSVVDAVVAANAYASTALAVAVERHDAELALSVRFTDVGTVTASFLDHLRATHSDAWVRAWVLLPVVGASGPNNDEGSESVSTAAAGTAAAPEFVVTLRMQQALATKYPASGIVDRILGLVGRGGGAKRARGN